MRGGVITIWCALPFRSWALRCFYFWGSGARVGALRGGRRATYWPSAGGQRGTLIRTMAMAGILAVLLVGVGTAQATDEWARVRNPFQSPSAAPYATLKIAVKLSPYAPRIVAILHAR